MTFTADIQPIPRSLVPADFSLTDWESVQPFFDTLKERDIQSKTALEVWLKDVSELQSVISEEACWKQIRMTCDTENKTYEEDFTHFCLHIEPHIKPYTDAFNRKLIASPWLAELTGPAYDVLIRNVKKEIELFQEENIALQADLNILAQKYGTLTGKMTIEHEGAEYTLQQAARFLMQSDRNLRKTIYEKVNDRRKQDVDALNTLFDELLEKRYQVARNAGFDNYRDYKFKELGRFDYGVSECEAFHAAIRKHITPLVELLYEKKKQALGVDTLRPYDVDAEPEGLQPLSPFATGEELVEKSTQVFDALNPLFGECLRKMKTMHRFDVESRKGKAPGGYNCPLAETGAPFIFMNSAGTADDVVTMMHEGGHAIHSFLSHPLELNAFKEYPMEMAELASMSMELFTMEYWNVFYASPNEWRRAQYEELERALSIFPWIATIDAFQHWLYTHPGHTVAERHAAWVSCYTSFAPKNLNWQELESYQQILWQKQLHLFEVPFYYIEYGIAQLGALAMWKQYKHNPSETIQRYMEALALGGTATLPELYATAGIEFNFSDAYVASLADFVRSELELLQA